MKVIQNPINECYISQIVKIDIERITKIQAINELPLHWCNGVLFFIVEYNVDEITSLQKSGKLYLKSFVYAICKDKVEISKWNGYSIDVLNNSDFPIYEELTKHVLEMNIKN